MEIVKRVITEKNYDKNGKVVSEKVTEEHLKEKERFLPKKRDPEKYAKAFRKAVEERQHKPKRKFSCLWG
jgi:intergrase/recombinase